ncbi:hypothetical protein G7046_g318 [Stylonectria norvegica]|nr:hypothetical protein G7046_g318 [Stylonectria norvegica]
MATTEVKEVKLRTLGLLGGMTYHATSLYYSTINDYVQEHVPGNHSAKIVMHSFDYAEIIAPFHAGDYASVSQQLCTAAHNLKAIGADAIVLCVNTSHLWADDIAAATGLPLLHIIDYTGRAVIAAGLKKVALLGTKVTLEGDFIKGRLERGHGIEVLVPPTEEVMLQMDDIVFKELSTGLVKPESKQLFVNVVRGLMEQGAEGIILGCTELQLMFKTGDFEVPMFDTVELHAKGVAQWAIEG